MMIYIFCFLRSIPPCSPWCASSPYAWQSMFLLRLFTKIAPVRYSRDSSVRRGAFPGLGPLWSVIIVVSRRHSPANFSIVLVLEFWSTVNFMVAAWWGSITRPLAYSESRDSEQLGYIPGYDNYWYSNPTPLLLLLTWHHGPSKHRTTHVYRHHGKNEQMEKRA